MSPLPALFGAAFLAATILPAQSEAVLIGLLLTGEHDPWLLVGVATAGNGLGSLVNWYLGRTLSHFAGARWFPISGERLDKASRQYQRWGYWSLFLSWVPIIGDPLTVAAGFMRERLWRFTLIVFVAKAARYIVLAVATLKLAE